MAAPAQAEAPQGAVGSGRPLGRSGSNMSTMSGVSGVEAGAPAHKRKGSIEHEGAPPLQCLTNSCTSHSCAHALLHSEPPHALLLEPWLSVCTTVVIIQAVHVQLVLLKGL